MPATIILSERNGTTPGISTDNVTSINWKATDDPNYQYTNSSNVILAGTNSYEKYQYLVFGGDYSSITNVTVSHVAGVLPKGAKLMITPGISNDNDRAVYSKPTQLTSTKATYDLSAIGAGVQLLVGPWTNGADPAASSGKAYMQNKPDTGQLYSNYFITQLQTTTLVTSGDIAQISLLISFDES